MRRLDTTSNTLAFALEDKAELFFAVMLVQDFTKNERLHTRLKQRIDGQIEGPSSELFYDEDAKDLFSAFEAAEQGKLAKNEDADLNAAAIGTRKLTAEAILGEYRNPGLRERRDAEVMGRTALQNEVGESRSVPAAMSLLIDTSEVMVASGAQRAFVVPENMGSGAVRTLAGAGDGLALQPFTFAHAELS